MKNILKEHPEIQFDVNLFLHLIKIFALKFIEWVMKK